MKKRLISFLLAMVMLFSVLPVGAVAAEADETEITVTESADVLAEETPAECDHDWKEATCTEPWTCTICDETQGEALGHSWADADCDSPMTCTVCGETEGEALGHTWGNADCTTPRTCLVCGAVEDEARGHTWIAATCTTPRICAVCDETAGEAPGHKWEEAACTTPKHCTVCGETEGEALGHNYVDGVCTVCGEELFIPEAPVVKAGTAAASGCPELTWEAVEGAALYEVYRADIKDGDYAVLETVEEPGFEDTETVAGEKYYYYVVAVSDEEIASEKSNTVQRTCDLAQPVVTVSNDEATGKPMISWEPVEGAVSYKVYRSATGESGTYSRISTTTKTSVTNVKANTGETWYYQVRAISDNTDAHSAYSPAQSGTCKLEQPVVKAANVAKSGKIRLTWEAVEGAVEYQISRATSKNGKYKVVYTTEGTSYTNTAAEVGTRYYYKVCAVAADEAANSADSALVSRTCDLPRPVVTVSNDEATGKPVISWEAIDGAVSYKVYRSATGKDGTYSRISTTTATSVTNVKANGGEKWYYRVCAVAANTEANSAYSVEKSRTCDLAQPVVTVSNVADTGKIQISWEAVEGAVNYKVYRSATGEDGTYSRISTTTETSVVNVKANAGEKWYYKVRAMSSNTNAHSVYSAVRGRTCDLPRPADLTITLNKNGKPKLSWSAVEGAVNYQIYRSTDGGITYKLAYTASSTSYTNTGAVLGETYIYQVRAVAENTDANSARTEPVGATATYAAPTYALELEPGKGIKISWGAVDGVSSYYVYRRTVGGNWEVLKNTTETSWVDTTGKSGTTYEYGVRGCEQKDGSGLLGALATGKTIVFSKIDPDKPMIALTFDDGPSAYTKDILDQLEKYNSHATFFVVGERVSSYASTIQRAYNMGCEIGNHSWSHPDLSGISVSSMMSEISRTDAAVKNITGVAPALLRPPYGAIDADVKAYAGKPLILWSVDTRDWATQSSSSTISSVLNDSGDGSIVLMHDIYSATRDAAVSLIPTLVSRGYQLVTVSELAAYRDASMKSGGVYYSFN